MTITYTAEVATCSGLGNFWKLLFRWTGSIYKLLWPNLLIYSLWYFSLSLLYRFVLNESQKKTFELISLYCRAYNELIPISFVLGFYVSIVITRWWDQYLEIPWPDSLAMFVSTLLMGNDERGRLMRRTIMRYVNLSFVITLRMMCPRVKKRFPTLEHLVDAGIMQSNEKKIWEDLDNRTSHPKYWMPLVWAGSIVTRARKEGRIRDDFSMKTLIDGLCTFRGKCGGLLNYDWVCIPLVYTQFFFYMGWLKVAESLVNPFGEDDDDFEVNWLVDRNLQVSYLIVDEMHEEHPELIKDQYWDEIFPTELPYTMAAKQFYKGPPQMMFQGSTKTLEIPQDQVDFISSESAQDDDKN
ncbi:bestrophin-2-like isoform X2 [Ischnura elegans]|uniref:bestrophin-2-like isoform X2 n=1 Tax=Ischnura elegans TaxID=197161 RepID=UPI001ED8BBEA|nr:bestrophin-2-like isoform X2 [Ischnura elegans]